MINFVIPRAELEKALEKLKLVEKNGFPHSDAVFEMVSVGRSISDSQAKFETVILKAHPTDPSKDWGCVTGYEDVVLANGEFVWK